MNLLLKGIVPDPISQRDISSSDVWGKDLVLDASKVTHVSAPSGTGKTTLSNILYGLRTDFSGAFSFEFDSAPSVGEMDWDALRENKMAIVFQDLKLLGNLTALENILVKNNLTNHFTAEAINAYAARLGILNLLNSKCGNLSRGEQQRVAILRALCMPFTFIILDEPFSHLDDANAKSATGLIKEIAEANGAGICMLNLHQDSCFTYDLRFNL